MDNLYCQCGTDEELVSVPDYELPSNGTSKLTDLKVLPIFEDTIDIQIIMELILPDNSYKLSYLSI